MSAVFAAGGILGPDKAVLLTYANFADAHGYCWPSISRVADESGLSVSTVQRSKKSLATRGLIAALNRTDSKGNPITNLTRLNIPMIESLKRAKRDHTDNLLDVITFPPRPDYVTGVTPPDQRVYEAPKPKHSDAPRQTDRGYQEDQGVWSARPEGYGHADLQTTKQPSMNPQGPSGRTSSVRPSVPRKRATEPAPASAGWSSDGTDGRTDKITTQQEGDHSASPLLASGRQVATAVLPAAEVEQVPVVEQVAPKAVAMPVTAACTMLATPGAQILADLSVREPRLTLAGRTLADQAARVDALLILGWGIAQITVHLSANLPDKIKNPGGFLSKRLADLFASPVPAAADPAAAPWDAKEGPGRPSGGRRADVTPTPPQYRDGAFVGRSTSGECEGDGGMCGAPTGDHATLCPRHNE